MTYNWAQEDVDRLDGFDTDETPSVFDEPQSGPIPGSTPVEEFDAKPLEVEEDYATVMNQVDRRMRVAQYYRLILDGNLFDDNTPESKMVEAMVKRYVREQLEILFGMRETKTMPSAPIVGGQFTPEEVEALKAIIARVTKPREPELKKISSPPTTAVVAKKTLTPIKASAAPVPQAPRAVPQPPPKTPSPQAKAIDPRIPPQYRNNPTARIVNGQVWIQNTDTDGNLMWTFTVDRDGNPTKKRVPQMKNVTPVAKPVGVIPIPMPGESQAMQIEAARADIASRLIENGALGRMGKGFMQHSIQNDHQPLQPGERDE